MTNFQLVPDGGVLWIKSCHFGSGGNENFRWSTRCGWYSPTKDAVHFLVPFGDLEFTAIDFAQIALLCLKKKEELGL